MNQMVLIPIEKLEHHPENPRKDLGDLTELTESIRESGILQNLTVVHMTRKITKAERKQYEELYWKAQTEELRRILETGEINEHERFWVVIGNRRMEAAKAAGLNALPCVISDMDYRTQVATMLQENMQRADLTIYEQAQGFQMMMDLGYSEKEIGEKTGFSRKTVKERLKLAGMRKAELKKACEEGCTIMDLLEVAEIKDPDKQAEVLNKAGTYNFRESLNRALQEQEYLQRCARLEPILNQIMKPLPASDRFNSKYDKEYYWCKQDDDAETIMTKFGLLDPEKGPYYYRIDPYGERVEVFWVRKKGKLSDGELKARKVAMIQGAAKRRTEKYYADAFELRCDFVRKLSPMNGASMMNTAKHVVEGIFSDVYSWDGQMRERHYIQDEYIRKALGLPEAEKGKTPLQQGDEMKIPRSRMLVAWALGGGLFTDEPTLGWYSSTDGSYETSHDRAKELDEIYAFLEKFGYHMSDMEIALKDGTHECYQDEAASGKEGKKR